HLTIRPRPPRPTSSPYTTLFRSLAPEEPAPPPTRAAPSPPAVEAVPPPPPPPPVEVAPPPALKVAPPPAPKVAPPPALEPEPVLDRKSTRLNSSHGSISYAVFCL